MRAKSSGFAAIDTFPAPAGEVPEIDASRDVRQALLARSAAETILRRLVNDIRARERGMAKFWVIGGVYADTKFDRMADGGPEGRFGPFDSHVDAKAEWQQRAWSSVDDAHARYRIEEEGEQATAKFWVAGGIYTDTRFVEPVGGDEQWYGPFDSYADAKSEWGRRAWATVDDAHARYRIEKRVGDPRK